MTLRAETPDKRQIVADTLREKQSEFDAFVRTRVAPQDVDDVRQLAALRAIERAETLDDPASATAWIYRIHRNLIIDTLRKRARERNHVDTGAEVPDPPSTIDADPCACSVSQANRLRPAYASILAMVDAQGLRLADAARRLDVTENNAAVRLHRARKALRKAMLEHCGVEDASDCASCRCVDDVCCAA